MKHITTNSRLFSAATTVLILLYFALLSSSSFAAPVIYLVSIGTPSGRIRQLSHRNIEAICPYDFAKNNGQGFTLECAHSDSTSQAHAGETSSALTKMAFAVNGLGVKVEKRKPYFISGDVNGLPNAWRRYPHVAVVSCLPEGRSDNSSTVTVVFSCHKTEADIDNEYSEIPRRNIDDTKHADTFGNDDMVASSFDRQNGQHMASAQSLQTDSTLPAAEPIEDETDLSMAIIPPPRTISEVLKDMDKQHREPWSGKEPRKASESRKIVPSPIANRSPMDASSATKSITKTTSTTTATTSNTKNDTEDVDDLECIVVDARRDLVGGPLTPGWTYDEQKGGLTFRSDDWSESITPSGRSPLDYIVTPRKTSRYAVVVDMTTIKGAEHNDLWVRVTPGGLQAMRKEQNRKIKTGWVKGYHNKKGRAAFVSTIDNNPHSLSTGDILKEGESYEVSIAGRSSMVTLHRIIMFPCRGVECMRSKSWNESLKQCVPDLQNQK